MHANIYVHSIRLTTEFPIDEINFIGKLQSHCATMTFADKIRYYRTLQQVTHKGVESAMNYIKIFQNAHDFSIYVGNY